MSTGYYWSAMKNTSDLVLPVRDDGKIGHYKFEFMDADDYGYVVNLISSFDHKPSEKK